MLRSIRRNALTLPEPEALRGALLTMVKFVAVMALCWALSRAVLVRPAPMAGLAPFSMALFAAGLSAGLNPAALLAGCLAGAVNGPLETFNLCLPIGCAVILGGSLLWSLTGPALGRLRAALTRQPEGQARLPNENALAGALAGLGTLIPGLIYAGFVPPGRLSITFCKRYDKAYEFDPSPPCHSRIFTPSMSMSAVS